MERFFRTRDRWGNGFHIWVLAVVIFSFPLLYIGVKHLDLENDITSWLPEGDPDAQVLNWFDQQFEHDSNILATWDSSTLADPRVRKLQQAILGKLDGTAAIKGVKEVNIPQGPITLMAANGIPYEQAVRRLTGVLIGEGFLKIRLPDAVRNDPAKEKAHRVAILDVIDRATGKHAELIAAVPQRQFTVADLTIRSDAEAIVDVNETGEEINRPLDEVVLTIPKHDLQVRWEGMSAHAPQTAEVIRQLTTPPSGADSAPAEAAFFAPGAPASVSMSLNDFGDENLQETVAAIQHAALSVGIPEAELHMGGSPIARNRLNREGIRAVWNREYPLWNFFKRSPVLLSMIVGILSSFILLRSIRLALLVVATAVYTCVVALCLVPASGRTLNIVLVVLPNLLLVLTMSGAIHVANYWKYARLKELEFPVASAVKMAWQPCFLASLTTAIGMISLVSAVLTPVREFGIYSSLGTLISLAVILFVFPSLLLLWPPAAGRRFHSAERDARVWEGVGRWLVTHRKRVMFSCLAVFAVSAWGLRWFHTETKVIRYFPASSRVVRDYNYLEEALAGIVSIETLVSFDQQALEDRNVLERMELVRRVEEEIEKHPWVSGTLSLADFRPTTPPPGENASFRERLRYGRAAQRTEDGIFEDQAESTKSFANHVTRPLSVENIHIKEGDEVWRIRAQATMMGNVDYGVLVNDLNDSVNQATQGQKGVQHVITGMVPLFLRTQYAVLESLIESFALAFAVIAIVMMVLLRNPVSGLLAMLPNLFPVGVVFGLVSWLRVPVDIGTMITASVALGIAIDGTLHLLTWFQDGLKNGMTREESVALAMGHCGPALWQTSLSIAAGILMLAGADLLLIRRFGWLMALLVVVALVADVVLLPALLGGWMGRIIARRFPTPTGPTEEPEFASMAEASASPEGSGMES